MVTSSEVVNTGYSVLALVADAAVLAIAIGFGLSRTSPSARERWGRFRDGVSPIALHLAWIVAVLATLGSLFLRYDHKKRHSIFYNAIERCLQAMNHGYERSLLFVLRHRFSTLVLAFGLLGASIWLKFSRDA